METRQDPQSPGTSTDDSKKNGWMKAAPPVHPFHSLLDERTRMALQHGLGILLGESLSYRSAHVMTWRGACSGILNLLIPLALLYPSRMSLPSDGMAETSYIALRENSARRRSGRGFGYQARLAQAADANFRGQHIVKHIGTHQCSLKFWCPDSPVPYTRLSPD